jgi:hypothetical protein
LYEGIDLVPGGPEVLSNNRLNLWRGWGVEPKQGTWPLMAAHIRDVLADGDEQAALYIFRWIAWALQNPGKCAEVALVFRGAKGTGKGALGNALVRIFGAHGVHIADKELLTGRFKGHLEFCLFLFADESFWAGDRKGIGTLQGLITEDLYIEKKGVDAFRWTNRLHITMAANADWVVPATGDERRYMVNDVANTYAMNGAKRAERKTYFDALFKELNTGGLEAMMYDLLHLNLGEWHPRQVYETKALRKQKEFSMNWIERWWDEVLQDGRLPGLLAKTADGRHGVSIWSLVRDVESRVPQAKGRVGDKEMRHFLEKPHVGGEPWRHRTVKNGWKMLPLAQHRGRWERHYGGRTWDNPEQQDWQAN